MLRRHEPSTLGAMPDDLRGLLSGSGRLAGNISWQPLSGGRTNRAWSGLSDGVEVVCKLVVPTDENPLFPNETDVEWAAMTHLMPLGIAPVPICRLPYADGEVLLYQKVLGEVGTAGAAELAQVLARLHEVAPWGGLPTCVHSPEAILAEGDAMAAGGPDTLLSLRPSAEDVLECAATVVHRDPIPTNTVRTDGGVVLLDWPCAALGDPCEDLAHASSPAMQHVYPAKHQVTAGDLLEEYQNPYVKSHFWQALPLYRWRMAVYCHWKAAQGDAAYHRAMELELEALEQGH